MSLEKELKDALRRKQPPAGFTDRVMQRINQVEDRRPRLSLANHRRAIAATLLLTAVLGAWSARTIAERREGERAREELLQALRITSQKLQTAQNHVVK